MPILVRPNGGKSIANSEDYDLANDVTEIVDSLNVNAPIGSTAERDALVPFEGMTIVRTDLKGIIEVYTNGKWTGSGSTAITTFGTGWTAVTSNAHTPRLYRSGGIVFLVGAIQLNQGGLYSHMLTVPTEFRPVSTATMFVGSGVNSAGVAYELTLAAGILSIPTTGYKPSAFVNGDVVPVTCSWPLY
jgi:hypothetical protein